MTDTNVSYNEAIVALKNEYEEKLAVMEAECALLRGEIEQKDAAEAKAMADAEAYLNEYVDVKLFRDSDRYSDDVYVAVNGQNCVIKRGEWVKIKRKFALVLDQSEIQDMKTDKLISEVNSAVGGDISFS